MLRYNALLGPDELEFVIPAHNEEATIAEVARACASANELLGGLCKTTVVSDCSTDRTALFAAGQGCSVISLDGHPSKGRALSAAVAGSSAKFMYFIDADCVGLEGAHLAKMAQPVLEGSATMSVGVFDYGALSGVVQRFPWSTGQRILERKSFPLGDERITGYNVELLINENVGRLGGNVTSFVLSGVRQRTKAAKYGPRRGFERNMRMWQEIAHTPVDRDAYSRYMERVISVTPEQERQVSPRLAAVGQFAMSGLLRLLR